MTNVLSLLFLFFASLSPTGTESHSQAQSIQQPVYEVQATIYDGSIVVGHPRFRVLKGSEVVIGHLDPRGYAFRLTVGGDTRRPDNPNAIIINSELHYANGPNWILVGKPRMGGVLGSETRMTVQGQTARGGASYTVAMTVRDTGEMATAAVLRDLADCPLWQAVSKGVALDGVTQVALSQTGDQPGDQGNPCCTGGPVQCCGMPGSCCYDDNLPGSPGCCV